MSGGEEFNVDGNHRYQWPARQLGMWSARGRPKGHAVSKSEVVKKINCALRDHHGPIYKWWAAGVLGVSEVTLRALLTDYCLPWPPPW